MVQATYYVFVYYIIIQLCNRMLMVPTITSAANRVLMVDGVVLQRFHPMFICSWLCFWFFTPIMYCVVIGMVTHSLWHPLTHSALAVHWLALSLALPLA